jgi:threonine synthase
MEIACTNCRQPYPEEGMPYRCQRCGGVFDMTGTLPFEPARVEPNLPGIWRFRHTFGLPEEARPVSLGEGSTPLVWAEAFGQEVGFKLEFSNPTGSFKDRGSAVLAAHLLARGVEAAVEDSSGNAGASFAAYAARAGIDATIYIPAYASGPKRKQIEVYGAQTVPVEGPRSQTTEAVRQAAEAGSVYASHAYLPQALAGYATLAYELHEQMGSVGAVVVPAGQGNLLLAVGRGFAALQAAGMIERVPRLIGVQARACAPLWAFFSYGRAGHGWVTEGETLAEGVRILHPVRGDAVIQIVEASEGRFLAVDEDEILSGRDELARCGLYVEPTSAIIWSALRQIAGQVAGTTAVILTGSGLKTKQ